MLRYLVTSSVFLDSDMPEHIHKFVDVQAPMCILDIEPFEGLSTCMFSDAFLNHDTSKLVAVGTFIPTQESFDPEKATLRNVLRSRNPHKVEVYNMSVREFFVKNQYRYDIVSFHEYDIDTIRLAFEALKTNGMMWFFGYMDKEGGLTEASKVVDKFVNDNLASITIVHRAKDLALIKVGSIGNLDTGLPLPPPNSAQEGRRYTVGGKM